ncbi:hypothetical protein SAMN04487928_12176 [Butyrivibrio proteoclasticus]|uniref:Uncharacterized protein n=1 Tax=Butyrivibrio proteoclasticus TaxID=43305 RepID=A0A1I5WBM9_9FIRM|nr:hypothetical protein [Butyrivibrio proteoclasticus]SFQ17138.1 hypothetical protein SAMN04487928_12176 [Butyrivibrio proteoclasticus]
MYKEVYKGEYVSRIEQGQNKAYAFIDGKEAFSFDRGKRIETDMEGKEHLKENDL